MVVFLGSSYDVSWQQLNYVTWNQRHLAQWAHCTRRTASISMTVTVNCFKRRPMFGVIHQHTLTAALLTMPVVHKRAKKWQLRVLITLVEVYSFRDPNPRGAESPIFGRPLQKHPTDCSSYFLPDNCIKVSPQIFRKLCRDTDTQNKLYSEQ